MTMYDAKESGRDRVAVFDTVEPARVPRVGERIAWAERIDNALVEGRFVAYAQPVLDSPQRPGVAKAELLVRLIDETGKGGGAGRVPRSRGNARGQIQEIDPRDAASGPRRARAAAGTSTRRSSSSGVNLSARSLDDPNLLQRITDLVPQQPGASPAAWSSS